MSKKAQDEKVAAIPDPDISNFGIWVRDNRIKQLKSIPELAKSAGIAVATLYGIESGKFQNPQAATRDKLAKALDPVDPPPPPPPPTATGVGVLTDFDPHSKQDWPKCSSVYVLYDVSQRPIYIGQGVDIAVRLNHHIGMFWYKDPIVKYGSFIEVKDKTLCAQLELVLIKVLKNNAVINKQGVEYNFE
jgi:transcriptional regulator with XRE-family HTH domain